MDKKTFIFLEMVRSTRSGDVAYCGVDQAKIDNAKPVINQDVLEMHYHWMKERLSIQHKKDNLKLPKPWTDDPVLQQVKFTNLRREMDRESKLVIQGICQNMFMPLKDKCFSIFLERLWNRYSTYSKILPPSGQFFFPLTAKGLEEASLRAFELSKDPTHGSMYTSAYMTAPVRNAVTRVIFAGKDQSFNGTHVNPSAPLIFAYNFFTDEMWKRMEDAKDMEELWNVLSELPYMGGGFLTQQVVWDFTYIPGFRFSQHHWTHAGPGCRAGLDLLFKDKDGLNHRELLFWLRDNQIEVYGPLGYDPETFFEGVDPSAWNGWRYLDVNTLENTFCELSKYHRCLGQVSDGKKPRGKVNYDGGYIAPVAPNTAYNFLDNA